MSSTNVINHTTSKACTWTEQMLLHFTLHVLARDYNVTIPQYKANEDFTSKFRACFEDLLNIEFPDPNRNPAPSNPASSPEDSLKTLHTHLCQPASSMGIPITIAIQLVQVFGHRTMKQNLTYAGCMDGLSKEQLSTKLCIDEHILLPALVPYAEESVKHLLAALREVKHRELDGGNFLGPVVLPGCVRKICRSLGLSVPLLKSGETNDRIIACQFERMMLSPVISTP